MIEQKLADMILPRHGFAYEKNAKKVLIELFIFIYQSLIVRFVGQY